MVSGRIDVLVIGGIRYTDISGIRSALEVGDKFNVVIVDDDSDLKNKFKCHRELPPNKLISLLPVEHFEEVECFKKSKKNKRHHAKKFKQYF